jgi:uncharacterized protein
VDEADLAAVTLALGRTPRTAFVVVVRGPHGEPWVTRNAPFEYDSTPMPTLYWLLPTHPLSERIGHLEAGGGVKQAEAEVAAAAIEAVHGRYAAERDACIAIDHQGPRPSGGVGGTRRGVKCLHAHFGYLLAGGDDPVGRWVAAQLCETVTT